MAHHQELPQFAPRPIIFITGATGGVGYGICLRLLYQLSQPFQADLSAPYHLQSEHQPDGEKIGNEEEEQEHQSIYATPNGLTLLIGCRSESKCRMTQMELEKGLRELIEAERKTDQEELVFSYIHRISGQVESMSFYEYRSRWLDRLTIDWVPLDLLCAKSVLNAVSLVNKRYGYITHLLLNAGGGPFVGIDWLKLLKASFRNLLDALTYPDYLIQATQAKETSDGIPETWQLNVLSHYILARESLPLLAKGSKRTSCRAKMIWTGSLDGQPHFLDRKDLECFHATIHAYQSTKYQVELVGQAFHDTLLKHGLDHAVVSLVAHPGVVAGNMFLPIIGVLMDTLMRWVFHFARLVLGSRHHVISGYLAGLVWTKVCLSGDDPLAGAARRRRRAAADGAQKGTPTRGEHQHHEEEEEEGEDAASGWDTRFVRLGAQCDRRGRPAVVLEAAPASHHLLARQRRADQHAVMDLCDRKADALIRLCAPP
ncbi:hypothetical protein PCANC_15898 [Puccinia coronata f. sp. avenae]|uniref:3-keto sterol reductase n=1 Tax=Puccinia coronata f. sp. avenae TaxID=200324 RepID=A0A2N5UMN0_9BASI|nr:hypothetical protein PCANC_15898 [Puccinia coronata f. sp. avenae]